MKPILKNLKLRHFCEKTKDLEAIRAKILGFNNWIKFFRESLNMTQTQLAKKLGVSQPAIKGFEEAEVEGSITLKTLRKIADSLDADLVYALVPRKDINTYINDKAVEVAKKNILSVNHTMGLENQKVDDKELNRRIMEYAKELTENLDRKLWD